MIYKLLFMVFILCSIPVFAMDAVQGGNLPQPLFQRNNWWNQNISTWPTDSNSASYIAFINNGGVRHLHPDFGGSSGVGNGIYGMPYAVVSGVTNADLKAVNFLYADESDGVNHTTGQAVPFYPIPPAAMTQSHWIEGGDPGNVDLRNDADRHLFIVDQDRNYLYELYNVFYDTSLGQWQAGSGAFFDMNTNNRRPDGWTSADAAGLAILPGLVRYDEAYDDSVSEIRHAFRVTMRSTNGYVYPASHRAGSTSGALPMGARLRLKASVDITQKTGDRRVQKILRAMQQYGLIVADNGSDMFITGTYDTRWDNDILNPAFSALTANDFELIKLGYNPTSANTFPLSISKVGDGTITSTPAGISCGTTCSASFNNETSVTLTATSATGNTFTGWGGACSGTGSCTVSMTAAQSVTATFSLNVTAPVCTLSANPSTVNAGSSSTLTATCTPVATSYIWSYSTCDMSINVCPAIFQ